MSALLLLLIGALAGSAATLLLWSQHDRMAEANGRVTLGHRTFELVPVVVER